MLPDFLSYFLPKQLRNIWRNIERWVPICFYLFWEKNSQIRTNNRFRISRITQVPFRETFFHYFVHIRIIISYRERSIDEFLAERSVASYIECYRLGCCSNLEDSISINSKKYPKESVVDDFFNRFLTRGREKWGRGVHSTQRPRTYYYCSSFKLFPQYVIVWPTEPNKVHFFSQKYSSVSKTDRARRRLLVLKFVTILKWVLSRSTWSFGFFFHLIEFSKLFSSPESLSKIFFNFSKIIWNRCDFWGNFSEFI